MYTTNGVPFRGYPAFVPLWIAALTTLLLTSGCGSPFGTPGDDDDDTTASPSPSATPNYATIESVLFLGRFGLDNDGAGGITLRDYIAKDTQNNDVTVLPSLDLILYNADQTQFCIITIEQAAGDLSAWTTNPVPAQLGTTTNGIPYDHAGFEFDMATADTRQLDCNGFLNPEYWTNNPEEAVRGASYGMTAHNALDPPVVCAMNGSGGGTGGTGDPDCPPPTDANGEIEDSTEWADEWEDRMTGGSPLWGDMAISGAWGFRIGNVDAEFRVVDQSWATTTGLDPANEPGGAWVMFTPFVVGFGSGSEAQLAATLLGTSAVSARHARPMGRVDFEELGINPWLPASLDKQ